MSAELLRRAATKMREQADAATGGPWFVNHFDEVAAAGCRIGTRPWRSEDAEHIASWDPTVAIGIASLFDNLADELERVRPCETGCANCSDMRWSWPTAELVARDFLGEPS